MEKTEEPEAHGSVSGVLYCGGAGRRGDYLLLNRAVGAVVTVHANARRKRLESRFWKIPVTSVRSTIVPIGSFFKGHRHRILEQWNRIL